uniref:Integrase catalytic domain-containing protein n=1 Tax=Chromera velia CCMP2878 TaxID=1169474 RepID=A0A0G4HBZ1_9ALVE|eukprot:Cvel_6199.t1-p1 / transcript=Cvel_6199.t1 / gene=Cvel_6199 / organism=Chromera_velia_CCMP2878 / gene_product=hypothetical protein / transcript_product=hypothetical protein / location=Cvel_scaffold300:51569-54177(+) / protein_length=649 / sequence_SO=supercontig / SO=protein_coding / is_pseudo=false
MCGLGGGSASEILSGPSALQMMKAERWSIRHLIGGDLEDSIVSRRPREFRYEEASGGEMICAEEVEASPVLEGMDGNPVSPLFRGAFKSLLTERKGRLMDGMIFGCKSHAVRYLCSVVRRYEPRLGKFEVVQTDNGGEFTGNKKGQYDDFCQKERVYHCRGADYTPQHQGAGERSNRTVKRLLRKVRRQTGLPPYCEKWLFRGVVQELNNCVSTVTGQSAVRATFGEERSAEIPSLTVGNRVYVYNSRPRKKNEEPIHGVEGFFGGTETSNVVTLIIKKNNGWKPIRVPPSSMSLVSWRGIDSNSFPSSLFPSGVSSEIGGERKGVIDDDCAASVVDVEEVSTQAEDFPPARFSSSFSSARFFPDVLCTATRLCERLLTSPETANSGEVQTSSLSPQGAAHIQLQSGQLEMHAEQKGGDEGEETEGRIDVEGDSEPRRGARRQPKREGREEREAVPLSPVAEDVELEWEEESDRNALRAQEDEGEKEVCGTQEDEKKEEALRERLGKLKEELARLIEEKKKRRRPLTRVVPVDPKVVKEMMEHVNPRKGHIDATPDEVAEGLFEGAMQNELERFIKETVFARGLRMPRGRKVMRCRWVLTWKKKAGKRLAKAQLVVKGFQDDRKNLWTYSGTADWWSVLLVLSFASTKG